jgi:hypothetical protein
LSPADALRHIAKEGRLYVVGHTRSHYSVVEDRLYAAVMLEQAGTVTLESGNKQQSFSLPTG